MFVEDRCQFDYDFEKFYENFPVWLKHHRGKDSGMGHIANRITMSIVMCLILSTCSQTNTSVSSPEGDVGHGFVVASREHFRTQIIQILTAREPTRCVASEDQTLALDHTTNAPLKDAFAPSMPDRPMVRLATQGTFSPERRPGYSSFDRRA